MKKLTRIEQLELESCELRLSRQELSIQLETAIASITRLKGDIYHHELRISLETRNKLIESKKNKIKLIEKEYQDIKDKVKKKHKIKGTLSINPDTGEIIEE